MRLASLLILSTLTTAQCPATAHHNQTIINDIITAELADNKDTTSLFTNIDAIGQKALEKGFDTSTYKPVENAEKYGPTYKVFPLWEGKKQANTSLLLYVWPSEKEALQYAKEWEGHKTVIHSHPVPCAYTVLSGAITELQYERTSTNNRQIQLLSKEILHKGDKTVDLTENPFIHQLVNESNSPTVTLHIYASPSCEELWQTFNNTWHDHVFHTSLIVPD